MTATRDLAAAGALALAITLGALSCDPVLSDQRSALGGEAPDVHTGPLDRPGQPCTLCHDGALSDPPAFSVAGTVFQNAGSTTALSGVTVTLTGVDGASFATTTNEAGNFYVTPDQFSPAYPMKTSLTYQGTTVAMVSHVGWAGSCATCHVDPAAPDSPGHVYFDVPSGQVP